MAKKTKKTEVESARDLLVEKIAALSDEYEVNPRYANQIEVKIPVERNVVVLSFCQTIGFNHLSNILAVDWLEEGEMEVLYNLWSYEHKVHCTVKVRSSREEPLVDTVMALWPQAQVYEQEVHEFFGIVFRGNPDLSPFFLHNWLDKPPLRKDFDSEEYSRKAYGFIEDGKT